LSLRRSRQSLARISRSDRNGGFSILRRNQTLMLKCPSCGSPRVRSGYRPPSFPSRLIGYRELLCDNCNYLYRGFSPLAPKHTPRSSPVREPGTPTLVAKQPLPTVKDPPKPPTDHSPARPGVLEAPHLCPFCGSADTRRRRRRLWERVFLLFSAKRRYFCVHCGESFRQKSHSEHSRTHP
jgi:transposase-like protein